MMIMRMASAKRWRHWADGEGVKAAWDILVAGASAKKPVAMADLLGAAASSRRR